MEQQLKYIADYQGETKIITSLRTKLFEDYKRGQNNSLARTQACIYINKFIEKNAISGKENK